MRLQIREQVLDIWRSLAAYSYRDGRWHWADRSGSNSISDAEQLLCILHPATNIPPLRLDNPDETAPDVLAALRGLGNDLDILRVLTGALLEYMCRHRDDEGNPTFTGATRFRPVRSRRVVLTGARHELMLGVRPWGAQASGSEEPPDSPEPEDDGAEEGTAEEGTAEEGTAEEGGGDGTEGISPTPEQARLDLVDSMSTSVTLCLSTLGFIRTLRSKVTSRAMQDQLAQLDKLASERLTAAMTGLLRSFSVNVFDVDSDAGRTLCEMVNQGGDPLRLVGDRLARALGDIRAGLREELSIGSGQVVEQLENPLRLFECGWSWGVIAGAPVVAYGGDTGQRAGVAQDRPYLYFTSVALDSIEDLFSERTRILGLLTDEQHRMASALQLRWDLCIQFWHRVATFGTGRWPLEDIPWRTTDGAESDHFSLLLASIEVQRLHVRGLASTRAARIGAILEELANRGRVTRRPLVDDPALKAHHPGTRLTLLGSETIGPLCTWPVPNYSSLLLKRAVQLAALTPDTREREQINLLADRIWEHLRQRRLGERPEEGLWDRPDRVFDSLPPGSQLPSWYHTQRVCECLVAAAGVLARPAPASLDLVVLAEELLAEAEFLYDQERLYGTWSVGRQGIEMVRSVGARLERARALRDRQPGISVSLTQAVLLELDQMAMARARPLIEDLL